MCEALGVYMMSSGTEHGTRFLHHIAVEIAFLMAPTGQDLRAAYLWTRRNVVCDFLSRQGEGEQQLIDPLQRAVKAKLLRTHGVLAKN